ncbi:hypothetical protein ACSVDE_06230 [Pseudalkalibacillus sp. Hm43]|uniref:hypothetical protein n=1 Tax=Pseudalkalibacillus sp. Hm43 TaxID=3450742 RepID=UPI003F43D323
MAFGIKRDELQSWKEKVNQNQIAFLTHYWIDERFPDCNTVTKVGCKDLQKLFEWGQRYGLKKEWVDYRWDFPHFDLVGERQLKVLKAENQWEQIERFKLDG